ncbi:MAG: LysR family transcriptional regulator [Pseudomonadota bacterium]
MNTDIDISKFRKLDGGLLLILHELLHSGSVTQTAQTLNLSQSTISQALGRLRDLFEDPLFVRRPHGLEPTQHALELEPQIAAIIDLASNTLDAGQSFDPVQSSRHFTLSAPEFVTATMATPLFHRLSDLAPNVGISFVHMPEPEVFDQLRRGEVAVAIGRFDRSHVDIYQATLYLDEFCVACRQGHSIAGRKLTEKRYKAQKHIWANAPSETIERDAEFDYSDYRGSIVPRWLTALIIAAQSDYIATCPRRLAESQAELMNLEVLDLPEPEPLEIAVAFRKGLRDKGTEWLIQQIHAAAQ